MKKTVSGIILCIMMITAFFNTVTAEDEYIFREDFQNLDGWTFRIGSRGWPVSPEIVNGALYMQLKGTRSNSNQVITAAFEESVNVENATNMVMDCNFSVGDVVPVMESFPIITGGAYEGRITEQDGNFYYRVITSDSLGYRDIMEIKPGNSYSLKVNINFYKKTRTVTLTNINENKSEKLYDLPYSKDVSQISQVQFFGYCNSSTDTGILNVDCLYIYNDEFAVKNLSIDEGQENVKTDSDIEIYYTKDVDKKSLNEISVIDENGNEVLCDKTVDEGNEKCVKLYFPIGLKYNTAYSLLLPDNIADKNGNTAMGKTVNFKTEKPPFSCEEICFFDANNNKVDGDYIGEATVIKTQANFRNESGIIQKIYIITAVYEDKKLCGLSFEPVEIENGGGKRQLKQKLMLKPEK